MEVLEVQVKVIMVVVLHLAALLHLAVAVVEEIVVIVEIQADLVAGIVEIIEEVLVMLQDQVADQTTQIHQVVAGVTMVVVETPVLGAVAVAVAVLAVTVAKVKVVEQTQKEVVMVVEDYHIL